MARKVKIIEQYHDYRPPVQVNGTVELLMRHVPAEHLAGLRHVVMTNSASLLSTSKGKYLAEDGRRFKAAECNGLYSNGNIFLVMDRILRNYPEWFLFVPLIKALAIGDILYHEVGHHIHQLEQPGYRNNEEATADEWRDELLRKFFEKRYWYLAPPLHAYVRLIHPRLVSSKSVTTV